MMSSFAAMLASPAPLPIAVAIPSTDTTTASSSSTTTAIEAETAPPSKKPRYKDTNSKLVAAATRNVATIEEQQKLMATLQNAEAARRAALPGIAARLHGSPLVPETMAKLKGKLWKLDLIPGHNQELTVGSLHHLDCTITAFTDEIVQIIYITETGTIVPLSLPITEFWEIAPFLLWRLFIDPATEQPTTLLGGYFNAACSLPVICRVKAAGTKLTRLLPNHMGGGVVDSITKKELVATACCLSDADLRVIHDGTRVWQALFASQTQGQDGTTSSDEENNRLYENDNRSVDTEAN
jgi:hypothetical protein